jgi:AraC-like DNA-binding protein
MASSSIYHLDNTYVDPMDLGEISLIQIGRRFCGAGERIYPHTHGDWFELTIAIGGGAYIGAGAERTHVGQGDIYISFPCDIHEITADSDGFEYDYLSFVCNGGELCDKLAEISQQLRRSDSRVFRDERVQFLVRCAINEISSYSYGSDVLIPGLLRDAAIYTVRSLSQTVEDTNRAPRSDLTCYRVMNYIDTHIYSLTSLDELSEQFNYNYSYLSALFSRVTGKTLREYYLERRLEVARTMVLEKNKKIWEIAELLNYSSAFAFSKAFALRYGVSPKKMQLQSTDAETK